MKLFLSYPSAERITAERLALALEAEGHEVFFDRHDLPAGQPFHQRLREAVAAADAFVFLITPAALVPGSYTLAEMDMARQRWPRPGGHVLPVMLQSVPLTALPPYLAAVTLLQPQGEVVAETVAAVARLSQPAVNQRGAAWVAGWAAAVVVVVAALAAGTWQWQAAQQREEQREEQRARQSERQAAREQAVTAAAATAARLCQDGSHGPAMSRFAELTTAPDTPAAVRGAHQDCAMRWVREIRAQSGDGRRITFGEQLDIAQPVLLRGLETAQGVRAADLRAHFAWGERLRWREGSGGGDPAPHWQRALGEDPGNVFAHAMLGNVLLPAQADLARNHFAQAVVAGRERAWVRVMQFGAALSGGDAEAAYAVSVADEMRRGGESLSPDQRRRLANYAFGTRLLNADTRAALFAALPADRLLATHAAVVPPPADGGAASGVNRFGRALLQAHAGQTEPARATLLALQRELTDARQGGRLLDETRRALAALDPPKAAPQVR